jgi:hypothetical protein
MAWLEAYLERTFSQPAGQDGVTDEDADDSPSSEETELADALAGCLDWAGDFPVELITGFAGIAVSWLEQPDNPRVVSYLARLVDIVEASAEHVPSGARWRSKPSWLSASDLLRHPDGNYNLGVSHGIPGLAVVLSRIARAGIEADRATALATRAMSWVLSQRTDTWVFPHAVADNAPGTIQTSLKWCYGGLGIGAALLAMGHHLQDDRWVHEGVSILIAASHSNDAGQDAGLCHGTTGAAHILNRAYQQTSEPLLRDAARHWFDVSMQQCKPGSGVGGFRAWTVPRPHDPAKMDPEWVDLPGWLEGSAGIGLALLGAVTDHEPGWDRLLAIS